MIRTIVQFTESQSVALKRLAKRRRTSVAAIVREAVEETISRDTERPDERSKRAQRARALAGIMDSGLGDLAENHDAYLAEGPRPKR